MKRSIIAFMFVAGTAMAGTTSKEVIAPSPAPEPSLWQWFAGGSVGYLFDTEEEMYHLHVGVDTPWNWGGWRPSIFLEAGYTENEESAVIIDPTGPPTAVFTTSLNSEFSMVPVTLNFKLERELVHHLSFYFGVGAGVAFTEFDASALYFSGPVAVSEDDEVFYAQVFAGLNYNVTDSFEIYGGARWLYLDDSDISGLPSGVAGFDDDFLGELGVRFNF
ncbi:outer membrane protein [Luteolibacter soli]|uniref:Outer membrane protein beta-barrel domain-containing protein n=1 Tax=Luteolibacter soli TaxID=3135280 RepID=A0ABU9APG9_9BACT